MDDLQRFEKQAKKHLQQFLSGKPAPKKPDVAEPGHKGYTVILCVRTKQLAPDQAFVHYSDTISFFEAQFNARKAARLAGWPIVTYMIDYYEGKPK